MFPSKSIVMDMAKQRTAEHTTFHKFKDLTHIYIYIYAAAISFRLGMSFEP